MKLKIIGKILIFFLAILFYQCKKKSSENPTNNSVDPPAQACRVTADVTETGQKIMEFNYNDKNQLTEIISNGWNSDGSLLYFNKRTIHWDSKNQQIRVDFYKQNTTTEIEFYSEYDYDENGKLITIDNFSSDNHFISHELRQYNKQGQLVKKVMNNSVHPIGFEYDANGDLIKSGLLNSEGAIIKPHMVVYEYDISRPAFTVSASHSSIYGEDIIRSMFMYDFKHSIHFCKRVYIYGAFGELVSDSNFQIEKSNAEGYPEIISRSINGDKNLKVTYQYNYNCN